MFALIKTCESVRSSGFRLLEMSRQFSILNKEHISQIWSTQAPKLRPPAARKKANAADIWSCVTFDVLGWVLNVQGRSMMMQLHPSIKHLCIKYLSSLAWLTNRVQTTCQLRCFWPVSGPGLELNHLWQCYWMIMTVWGIKLAVFYLKFIIRCMLDFLRPFHVIL